MKKNSFIILCVAMFCILCSCGTAGKGDSAEQEKTSTPTATIQTSTPTAIPTDTPTPTPDDSYAKDMEITLNFSFGARTGTYTGELNKRGLPDGQGIFSTVNDAGTKWTYEGEWVNGHFEGEGKTTWFMDEPSYQMGTYKNDILQPMDPSQTKDLWSNPNKYVGHKVIVTGRVFNIQDYDDMMGIQLYADVKNDGNNTFIYTYMDKSIKENDYISVTGVVDGILEYANAFGSTLSAVQISSEEVKKISYAEIVGETTLKTVSVNDSKAKYGYTVTLQKVEFASDETRAYVKLENNGKSKFSIYTYDLVIVQNGRQYECQDFVASTSVNFIISDLRPGVSSEGIIVFPAMDVAGFKLYIHGSSDNYNENIEDMVFDVIVK